MKDDTDYRREALDDAWAMLEHFGEDIADWVSRHGQASDDFNNDLPDGDGYHHETHVDKWYNLTEAAAILDQLSDHEETDSGLWDGQDPRRAISTQAAFTYGNAVASNFSDLIDDLNGHIDAVEDSLPEGAGDLDGWKAAVARMYCEFGQVMDGEDCDIKSLLLGVFDQLKQGQTAGLIAAKDWMRENSHDYRISTIDAILAHVPEPDEVEADE
jgi:hypothetical protein